MVYLKKIWVSFEYGAGISAAIYMNGIANDLAYVNMTNKFDCMDFAKAGIRVNPKNKGLFFNFYWKPHVNKVETRWAWFGLGIGYSWK
jgi:hypothetical protein